MSARPTLPPAAARRQSKRQAALVAAYRAGLGLAAVVVCHDQRGIRIVAVANGASESATMDARWWCRRATDAARVATAATARLGQRKSQHVERSVPATGRSDLLERFSLMQLRAAEAIAAAGKRFGVALYSDDEVSVEAARIIARVESEFERLRQLGELKTVNRSYRDYRTEASARGERVLPYAQWIDKYRRNLVRELATALRSC